MTTASWIVGGSGLLGSATIAAILSSGGHVTSPRIRWNSPDESVDDLTAGIDAFLDTPGATALRLFWAAGAGVTSTGADPLAIEKAVFEQFCERLAERLESRPEGAAPFSMFLASSAGGIYSGATGAPFDEDTVPAPVSHYGETKLAMERAVGRLVDRTGIRAVVGRITTLYGPGQRVDKPQGFISHLCKSMITNRPMSVYVPLDTLRDYLHVDDAATVVLAAMDRLESDTPVRSLVVKNLGSHVSVTLGRVLQEARLVFKRRPSVALAISEHASGQVHDLRVTSSVWPELEHLERRTLLVGLAQTKASMERRLNAGGTRAH